MKKRTVRVRMITGRIYNFKSISDAVDEIHVWHLIYDRTIPKHLEEEYEKIDELYVNDELIYKKGGM